MTETERLQAELELLQLEEEEAQEQAAKPRERHGASGTWELPKPGFFDAMGTRFNEGLTKKGSDELVGQIARHGLDPTPGRYLKLPDGRELPAQTPEEAEFAFREGERQRQQAAKQHFPKSGFVADMAGEVAGDIAAGGANMVTPAYQALVGGVRGYLGTDSDDAADKAVGSGVGALVGYGFGKLPEAASAASQTRLARAIAESRAGQAAGKALSSAAKWPGEALDRLGVSLGRSALSGAKGLKMEEALPDESVREAMDRGALQLFGTTKGASKRLTKITDDVADEYGRLQGALQDRNVRGANVMDVRHSLVNKADDIAANSTNEAIPELYRDQARKIYEKAAAPAGNDLRLGLRQSVNITRGLQKEAKYGKLEETLLNRAKRDIASELRQKTEDAVESDAARSIDPEVHELAAQFKPIKERLSRLIPADTHAYQEAHRLASRKGPSLMEMMAGGSMFAATQSPVKTAAALLGAHLLKTRGPSTGAVALRGLGRGVSAVIENSPQLLGDFGAVIAGQKTPEARAAMAEELALRYPAFAQMLETLDPPADGEASLSPAQAPRPGDPLRAMRSGR